MRKKDIKIKIEMCNKILFLTGKCGLSYADETDIDEIIRDHIYDLENKLRGASKGKDEREKDEAMK